MRPARYRAVLTGATGGIGRVMALRLAPLCESLLLVGRGAATLATLVRDIEAAGGHARSVPADLTTAAGREAVLRAAAESRAGLRQRRAAEAQRAAAFERTGKPVPADLKTSIANYDKQIQSAQSEITQRKAEQEKVRSDFEPVIQRLVTLTGKPASTAPAAPSPAPAVKP